MDFDARLDLTSAVIERDRLRARFERASGTRAEMEAYVDLHAANEIVGARERYLAWSEGTPLGTVPHVPDAELERYALCEDCAEHFEVARDGTDDRVQFDLGTPPSPRLAAELNREAVLGGEPPICEHCAALERFARA